MLGPDFDKSLKAGTFSARFASGERRLGSKEVRSTPVHAYATPSPLGKKAPKATFGTESRFGAEATVSGTSVAHHTPSPLGKKAPKATFGTASRFGTGSCDTAARHLPPRPRSLPPSRGAAQELPQQPQRTLAAALLKGPLTQLEMPTAEEVKELAQSMPLSAKGQSPWRHAMPLPPMIGMMPAEVAGAA